MAADMTDEEYDALDEEMTKADLRLTEVVGPFTRQKQLLDALDEVSANYIKAKAEEFHKLPTAIIRDMVREKIANAYANAVGEVGVAN